MMRRIPALFVWLVLIAGIACEEGLNGDWAIVLDTPVGKIEERTVLKVSGGKVTGRFGKSEVRGTLYGAKLALEFPYTPAAVGYESSLKLTGTWERDQVIGQWEFDGYSGGLTGKRVK